jgi:hypothetical protein
MTHHDRIRAIYEALLALHGKVRREAAAAGGARTAEAPVSPDIDEANRRFGRAVPEIAS